MKPHLPCAEQQVSRSNLTKYCACHAERLTYLIIITCEASFTMRGATDLPVQHHQILRLSRRKTHILSPHHIWNLILNARSNRCHHPTSANTAPVTRKDSHTESSWRMKRHLQCAEQQTFPSNITKYCACHTKLHYKISQQMSENWWNVISNAGAIREWSENDPTMIRPQKRKPQPASQVRLLFELTTSIFYWKIQRFAPNLTFKHSPSAAPATKSNTWTSPSTAPATKSNTWTSPSTAPATKCDTWTSPNAAPATKNDSYAWSSLHMKPHFQCAEPQVSLSNLTKHCACHEKWHCKISEKISKNRWNVISNAGTIREWSVHENANRNPPRNRGYFSSSPRAFSIEKIQRSAPNLAFKHSPSAAPATTWLYYSTWHYSTWHYSTWLYYSTWHYSTWLYSTLLYSTWRYSTWLYSTWLYATWLHSTYSTWLYYCTWLYSTWHYSTWLYSTWLYSTRRYSIWHDSTWHYSTWHYSTWHYSTWHYSTWHYSPWRYSPWRYSPWLYSTWLYSSWLHSTWLYSTWLLLFLTLLYLTLLGCRSYIGSFSSKLPLIIFNIWLASCRRKSESQDLLRQQRSQNNWGVFDLCCFWMPGTHPFAEEAMHRFLSMIFPIRHSFKMLSNCCVFCKEWILYESSITLGPYTWHVVRRVEWNWRLKVFGMADDVKAEDKSALSLNPFWAARIIQRVVVNHC